MKGYIVPNQRKSKSDCKIKTKTPGNRTVKYSEILLASKNNLFLFKNTQLLASSEYQEWKSLGPKADI